MCIGVPPRPKGSGPKGPKIRQHSETSTRLHCPLQASYSKNFPNAPLPPRLISSKTKHSSGKLKPAQPQTTEPQTTQPQTTSYGVTQMYASSHPPWDPSQSVTYSQSTYPAGQPLWPTISPQASTQQTSSSQSQKQDPSYIAYQAAKDKALADQIAAQETERKAAAEKRAEQELLEKVDARIMFGENLRKKLNPPPSAPKIVDAKKEEKEKEESRKGGEENEKAKWKKEKGEKSEKEKERWRKDSEELGRQEKELARYRREDEERKKEAHLRKMLDDVKGPMMSEVSDLKKSINDRERRAEIADVRSAARLEGMKEEQERNRVARGRGRASQHRSRDHSSDSERSRSRSRYRSTKNRQLGGTSGYGNGFAIGYGNGFGSAVRNNANYQLGAPLDSSNSPRQQGYVNQPLLQQSSNSNAYWSNHAIPYTSSGNHSSSNLLRTAQFQSTARDISGQLDYLQQGQSTLFGGFRQLDAKMDRNHQSASRGFQDLHDKLDNMGYMRRGPTGRRSQSPTWS